MADYKVHETAIVDEGATIGVGSRNWHWVHICGGAQIGMDCSLDGELSQDSATRWLWTYNNERPNMALGGMTPKQKVAMAA